VPWRVFERSNAHPAPIEFIIASEGALFAARTARIDAAMQVVKDE